MASFEAVNTAVAPEQSVSIGLVYIVVLEIFFGIDAVMIGMILNDRAGQNR